MRINIFNKYVLEINLGKYQCGGITWLTDKR